MAGMQGPAFPQTRLGAILMAITAMLCILVPVVVNGAVTVMVERSHSEVVRSHCTGTPREGGTRTVPRAEPTPSLGNLLPFAR